MAEILVIKLSALGDLVQADGALRDIREHHKEDRLTVMTTPPYQKFMQRSPWVDEVLVDPRDSRFRLDRMYKLRTRLRQRSFSMVYDLQQVGRTRFYYRWLFPELTWLGDAPGCAYYLKRPEDSCAADHFARHLQLAGLDNSYTLHSDVSWMAAEVDDVLQKHNLRPGYILLMPGASTGHQDKRWPCFAELAERLLQQGRRVVTVPGPAERDACGAIPGDMLVAGDECYDYFVLAGVAKKAGYVVGNDTGPTHIAAHMGGRGLALYGAHTAPETTGIQHTSFSWLAADNLADVSIDAVWQKIVPELHVE
jgi:ADP-heptose:LPS heptosyltransferase